MGSSMWFTIHFYLHLKVFENFHIYTLIIYIYIHVCILETSSLCYLYAAEYFKGKLNYDYMRRNL